MARDTIERIAVLTGIVVLLLLPATAAAVDCSIINVSPVADFTWDVVPAESSPFMVNFYSTSQGGKAGGSAVSDPVESYLWRFGDGSESSDKSPLHSYTTSSARYQEEDKPYQVSLIATTRCGRMVSVTKNVSVYCLDQKADFTIIRPEGEGPYTAPVALYIKDTSLHVADAVTTWHYTLWDDRKTSLFKESTEKDPVFTIRNSGSYIIRQEVVKGCSNPLQGSTVTEKTIQVTGPAASGAIPMETIPFTTMPEEKPATPAPTATAATTPPVSRTTAPAQQPAAASPGTGTLVVNTSPAGADVFVNNFRLGSGPATIPGLSAGMYNLDVGMSGYRNRTVRVEIGEGRVTEYSAVLEPESAVGGYLPVIATVLAVAAAAGAGAWYLRRRKRKQIEAQRKKERAARQQ